MHVTYEIQLHVAARDRAHSAAHAYAMHMEMQLYNGMLRCKVLL